MGMLHGDFGGRNILVSQDSEASWRIAGLIDWEAAGRGCRLWDVGSLFRYGNRYSVDFRDRFEEGYNAMGELPCDWYRRCRLLDSLRLLDIVNGERELPDVFAECRGLIRSVIDDWS
jgi:Ser/Thr protein kinase RdoA (MazF antagonist)